MNAGKLDRRITIQSRTVSRDGMGSRVETWADEATVWAKLETTKGSEGETAEAERGKQTTRWLIRHRVIDSIENRISYKGKICQITGIDETMGRENYLYVDTYALGGLS